MSHKIGLRLDIVVHDKDGNVTDTRHVESDILLRNYLCMLKGSTLNAALVAGDGEKDIAGTASNTTPTQGTFRAMTGNGAAAETSADVRIQVPLYTAADTATTGNVTLGIGNQVTVAVTSAHTFAAGATVTEAGLCYCNASVLTYLTAGNFQVSRNTFAGVVVPVGGTFTSTYTFTVN